MTPISEAAYDVAALEVGVCNRLELSGWLILLDEVGRPVRVYFEYRHGGGITTPNDGNHAAQWLGQHGSGDALEMVREAHDAHRDWLNGKN